MVRLATQNDAADVARLLIGFRDWWGRNEPADDAIAAMVERLLADSDTDFLLAGDPAVGVCQLRYRLSVWTGAYDCCLEDLFVDPHARRSGLGRALVEASFERARERGCMRIDLDANEANEGAVTLYGRLGFESWSDPPGGHNLFMRRRL